ncbi:MAG: UDP-N-acetylmuramate dehydrogenase [Candidatus Bipolaricaulota bacterium]|nr:UDP-N-acetylmuramate dehydrogenase [Candidatus Bipolaricaulota bacterium]
MDSDHEPVAFPQGGKLLHRVDDLVASLQALHGELRIDELLSSHTTIRVGGPADAFFLPTSIGSLAEAISVSRDQGVPYFILGRGSNVLFSDSGYRGLIISTVRLTACTVSEGHLSADCGTPLVKLISEANAHGVHSLDFLVGIPGTLGGALATNAGIKAQSIGEIVEKVTALSGDGTVVSIDRDACGFSYRASAILESRLPILRAQLHLDEEKKFDLDQLLARRAVTQPHAFPSAGCAFKNPVGRSAGELIEHAGLKGFRVGMAKVSDIHANFIINLGGASSAEIRKLIDIVRQKVYKSFHILLDLEIEVVDG